MAPTLQHRWHQFSLKTLFVMLTAVGLLLGLRIAYLRRQADFHAREADRIGYKAQTLDEDTWVWNMNDWQKYSHHRRLADEYRAAVSRPWNRVDESMRSDDFDLDGWVDLLVQSDRPSP